MQEETGNLFETNQENNICPYCGSSETYAYVMRLNLKDGFDVGVRCEDCKAVYWVMERANT